LLHYFLKHVVIETRLFCCVLLLTEVVGYFLELGLGLSTGLGESVEGSLEGGFYCCGLELGLGDTGEGLGVLVDFFLELDVFC
jgi:hypothetical protein